MTVVMQGASLTEVADAVRPIYLLGRHHGYRDALEDLVEAVDAGAASSVADVVAWAHDSLKGLNHGA